MSQMFDPDQNMSAVYDLLDRLGPPAALTWSAQWARFKDRFPETDTTEMHAAFAMADEMAERGDPLEPAWRLCGETLRDAVAFKAITEDEPT